jgi:hypothetical protein
LRELTGKTRPEKYCYMRANDKGENKDTQQKGTRLIQDKKNKCYNNIKDK